MKPILKLNDNNDMYWNLKKPLSYRPYMIVAIGGRGIGKTTTGLIHTMRNYINKDEEFIYLRRYKPELKTFMSKKKLNKIVDGVRYTGDGSGGYNILVDDNIVGYLIALAQADNYKSSDFDKVTWIVYDEAILKPKSMHHYLNKEVWELLNFASTVFRNRKNGHILIIGNNLDLFNPYFEFFDVPQFDDFYYDKERGLYCELCKNSPALIKEQMETPLYKLTKGTSFGDFHYDNKVLSDVDKNIDDRPNFAKIYCRIRMNDWLLNFYYWTDKAGNICMNVEAKEKMINDNITYTFLENNKANYYDVKLFRKKLYDYIMMIYSKKRMTFASTKASDIFNAAMEVL